MRLANVDKKSFYVAYFITENNGLKYYSDIMCIKGVYYNKGGNVIPEENGKQINYNASIVMEYKDKNIPININSILWIDKNPTDKIGYNYVVRYKSEVQDGLFTIYVERVDIDCQEIWFEYYGDIVPFKLDYNSEEKIGNVSIDTFIPFNCNTKIWEQEPTDINDTNGLIELTEAQVVKNAIILKFKSYE